MDEPLPTNGKDSEGQQPNSGDDKINGGEGEEEAEEEAEILNKTPTVLPPLNRNLTDLYPDWESQRISKGSEEQLEPEKRDKWKNSIEFIMTSVSSAVGLGNVWRFPFVCYENGGGAFLIPYAIVLVLMARPAYYVEAALGQFSSRGPTGMWDMVPIFRGVGLASAVLSSLTLTYYCAIIAYCCTYLGFGMQDPLPWKECDESLYVNRTYLFTNNFTCVNDTILKKKVAHFSNSSIQKVNAEMYFQYRVAQQLENIDDGIGDPIWYIALPLFGVWLAVFFTIVLGTKSSGKSAYFTAIFPYVVLITLLFRACSLPGAGKGLEYLFKPEFEKLKDPRVWVRALNQCFFSLSIGYGNIISFGSYNDFRQKISRDVMIVSFMDSFTSLLAAVTVFGVLGVLAQARKVEVSDVAEGGFSLLFVSYPEVLLAFGPTPIPQIFSFLFFAMLAALGIGSATGYLYTITSTIYDSFPKINGRKLYKILVVGALCSCFFLLGISMTTPGGTFLIALCDQFTSELICYTIVLFELIGVAWLYGMKSFLIDIDFMTNANVNTCWHKVSTLALMMWGYCVPIVILIVLGFVAYDFDVPSLRVNKFPVKFPPLAMAFGLVLPVSIFILIPGWSIYVLVTRKSRSCYKKLQASKTPNRHWGPKDPNEREAWILYKQDLDADCWLYKKMTSLICGKCKCAQPTKRKKASPKILAVKESKVESDGNEGEFETTTSTDKSDKPNEEGEDKLPTMLTETIPRESQETIEQ